MIKYDKLFEILKHEGITQYKLCTQEKIIGSPAFMKLKRNESVNTKTLDTLCNYLHVDLFDILEYIPDDE